MGLFGAVAHKKKRGIEPRFFVLMVPRAGIEPARPQGHWILNPARLPVPPPRHELLITTGKSGAKDCHLRPRCQALK